MFNRVSKNDHEFLLSVHASQWVSSSLPPSWPGMFHWDAPWEAPLIPKSVQHYGSLNNLLGSTAVQGNKNQMRPKAFTNLKRWNTAFFLLSISFLKKNSLLYNVVLMFESEAGIFQMWPFKYSWAAPLLNLLLLLLLFGLGLIFFVCFFEHYNLHVVIFINELQTRGKEGIEKLMFWVLVLCWGI